MPIKSAQRGMEKQCCGYGNSWNEPL